MSNVTIGSTYGGFSDAVAGGSESEDALTAKHKTQPERAVELQAILRGLGLASSVFDTTVARKRRIVQEGSKIMVDDMRFTGHSFKYFSVHHPLRFAAIRIVTYRRYNSIMAVVHTVSAALLLFRSDPDDLFPNEGWTTGQYFALVVDRLLIVVFTLDLVMSFVAHGVLKCVRQNRYLLDIGMLAASMAQELSTVSLKASTALFAVSSLRPLRVVPRMKSMMKLINILAACSEKLLQVAMLIVGICIVFATAAVILFRDASHTRCYDPGTDAWGASCNIDSNTDPADFLYAPCARGTFCREGAPNLEAYYSYDNIGNAMLVLVQIFTLDNWADLAVDMMNSLTPAAGVFFVLATFLLAYWATNQFTAVIFDSFSTTFVQEREMETRRQKMLHEDDGGGTPAHDDRQPVAALRFASTKGTAPQAQRSVMRMKESIARQSVASMKEGIKSVRALPYLRDEVTRAQRDGEQSKRSRRAQDFFLDDTSMDSALDVAYRYQQLEVTLPSKAQELLASVKESAFSDNRERNSILNQFHSMSDAAREKLLRFLQWRGEVDDAVQAHRHPGEGSGEGRGLPAGHLPQSQHLDVAPMPPHAMPHLSGFELQNEPADDDLFEMISMLSSRSSTGPVHDASKNARAQRASRPRHVKWQDSGVREYLEYLKDEHAQLWSSVSTVLPEVRLKRVARKQAEAVARAEETMNLRTQRSAAGRQDCTSLLAVPLLDGEQQGSFGTSSAGSGRSKRNGAVASSDVPSRGRSPRVSNTTNTSSSSSSSSSTASSQDTVDRAIAVHEQLHAKVNAPKTSVAARAASAVLRRTQQVKEAQRLKAARNLDDLLDLGLDPLPAKDRQDAADGNAGAAAGVSVLDLATSVEEYRAANRLLRTVVQEYNGQRVLPRPRQTLLASLCQSIARWQPRVYMYQLLRSSWYDKTLLGITLFNCVLLCAVHYDAPTEYDTFVDVVSSIVDCAIVFDTVVRIVLTSLTTYFFLARRNVFNLVEFLVMLLCTADIALSATGVVPFLRVFRVLRIMKFMRRFHLLRQLLLLIRTSLGYLVNLLLLQIIVWVMFTYCGRQLFGGSFRSSDVLEPCPHYTTPVSCNDDTANCIWVNETEWMEWNTSYMQSVKNGPHGRVRPTLSTSATPHDETHSTLPTVSRNASASHPTPVYTRSSSVSPSPESTQRSHSTSLSMAPAPNETSPLTAAPSASTNMPPSIDVHDDGRRCRQFQGWDHVSPFARFSFETLTFSFITVFDIVTKDNWSTVQYFYMEQVGDYVFIFFFAVVLVCGYLVLSLLVAILLVNFEQRDEVDLGTLEDDIELFDQEVLASQTVNATLQRVAAERLRAHLIEREVVDARRKEEQSEQKAALQRLLVEANEKETARQRKIEEALLQKAVSPKAGQGASKDNNAGGARQPQSPTAPASPTLAATEGGTSGWLLRLKHRLTMSEETKKSMPVQAALVFYNFLANFCDAPDTHVDVVEGKSLFLFPKTHRVRQVAIGIVEGAYFPLEKTIFWVTLVHCVVSPASKKLIESEALLITFYALDWIIASMGVVEMFVRCIAMGGFLGPHSYLKHGGQSSVIEMLLVVVSFVANVIPPIIASATGGSYKGTAIGFALKGFRPFRVVTRTSTMRNVVIAIARTVPELVSILAFSTVLYVMFSIMCVEAFRGKLRRCSDGSDRSMAECVGTWIAVEGVDRTEFIGNATTRLVPRQWVNINEFHFDDCYNGFTTLLKVSMVSSWSAVMFAMIDAPNAAGESPVRNMHPHYAGWLIFWVIFSNNFLINIFVGTIVDRFSKLKDQLQGNLFISAEQSEIARIKKSLVTKTAKKVLRLPTVPYVNRRMNEISFAIVSHPWFLRFVKYVLILNTAIIMSVHYQQDSVYSGIQAYGISLCSFVFIVEATLKVCVGGWGSYFAVKFHFVEAAVVLQGLVELGYFFAGVTPPNAMQVTRLIRIARLVRDAKGLRKILHTGYKALPAMGNIGAVLIAVMFCFAMVAIALFQDVRYDLTGDWFSPMFSLRTLPKAMFTLYSVATLDNWAQVQFIAGVSEPDCLPMKDNCGNMLLATLFLSVFVVSVTLIMLNLFMAVVLENFSDAVLLPQYLEERQKDVEGFRRAWSRFDNGRNVIHASHMVPLLESLPGPQQRFELLKETKNDAADDDSAHSLQSDEMRVYAETQTIGIGGCPHGAIIPTIRQLKLVVTMPQEEILYLDAISAMGEKIYHAQLVDERVRRAHERMLSDAEETHISFSVWYATTRFQKLFRNRLKEQNQYQQMVLEEKALAADPALARSFVPPRHISAGSALWNAVLDPIVVSFVRQHFRSAWTVDGSNTKMRKITLTKRSVGGSAAARGDEDVKEDDDMRRQRLVILDEASKRQTKSLAATIKERQVEVEEAPDVVEDTTWMTAVEHIDAGHEGQLGVTGATWSGGGDEHASMTPRRRLDSGTGIVCHMPPLQEWIQARRRGLLFQLYARSHQKREPLDAATLKQLAQQTTVHLKGLMSDAEDEWNLDVWYSRAYQWKPYGGAARLAGIHMVPPAAWRVELQLPLCSRSLVVQRKKKGPNAPATALQGSLPLVADWGVLFRIQNAAIVARVKQMAVDAHAEPSPPPHVQHLGRLEDDPTAASSSPIRIVTDAAAIDQEDLVMSPSLASSGHGGTRRRSGSASISHAAMSSSDYARRLPTLRERMETLGMDTTHMRLSEGSASGGGVASPPAAVSSTASSSKWGSALDRLSASLAAEAQSTTHAMPASSSSIGVKKPTAHGSHRDTTTNSFTDAPHRASVTSVRLMMEEGMELSPTAKALYKMENGGSIDDQRMTTSNTAGSYSLPVEEEDGMPRLSFAVMTRLSMAARRFKRRKMEAEAEALRRRGRSHHGPMSVHSRMSKGESEGAATSSSPRAAAAAVTSRVTGMFKKAANLASNVATITKKKAEVSFNVVRRGSAKSSDPQLDAAEDGNNHLE